MWEGAECVGGGRMCGRGQNVWERCRMCGRGQNVWEGAECVGGVVLIIIIVAYVSFYDCLSYLQEAESVTIANYI